MKRLALALPVILAVCLLAKPSTAAAGSFNFNWNHLSNIFDNHKNKNQNNGKWDWDWDHDQKNQKSTLKSFLKDCNIDWNKCKDDDYFSFKKNGKNVFKVKYKDLDKYVCKTDYNWFGKLNCFKLFTCDWDKSWDFDCIEWTPCEPQTPPDCEPPTTVVPTPAAAFAGLGLLGMLGAGRTLRRRDA